MIEINELKKSFGDNQVLKSIDLKIEPGEVVTILGPSGSGKTTLLRCINFLEDADSGSMRINDQKVDFSTVTYKEKVNMRRKTAMVFQQYALFKNKTALENITEGMIYAQNVSKGEAEKIASDLLLQVGLLDFKDYYPSQLSGGQQQRIGIVRAMALNPDVILFDEPTSSLDPELVGDILDIIKQLADTGSTMVIVTHEIGFAYDVSDKIVFMDKGFIIEEGTPQEVIKNPREARTIEFLEKTYF